MSCRPPGCDYPMGEEPRRNMPLGLNGLLKSRLCSYKPLVGGTPQSFVARLRRLKERGRKPIPLYCPALLRRNFSLSGVRFPLPAAQALPHSAVATQGLLLPDSLFDGPNVHEYSRTWLESFFNNQVFGSFSQILLVVHSRRHLGHRE